ncbi:N-acyl-D-amino-acid deacylase family protein [Pandoraea sputorum]|uniref:D-aminoacylase n=1 Tax=Pandoraea sputorum TaxID=93222 RepID=A0A239SC17_9BURK|nr:amidohydrolase family protein [Pandoraea sputorum]AJC18685.2 D-aminoacylase [Pandoraea sputorum]SNU82183.1 D-aminoacylase [Pandoraea sputorum]VVE44995.1 D-aminoacylase [Pandoraea sputorum]VVE82122.1 D-aminoacylase [Pandoraea sputorum]BET13300.1 D-aminoacylase [Pandoraea sputorum]
MTDRTENFADRTVDTLITDVRLADGSGAPMTDDRFDVALRGGRIHSITPAGERSGWQATQVVAGNGNVLSPGFIDVHTHDDTNVVRAPEMTPKLSQGVTTVVVGNCGISASPVTLKGDPPDPMNLLGEASAFQYPTFAAYVEALEKAQPSINVAALIGHTALRNNHMDRLDRPATQAEIEGMRAQLREALAGGALGLSTGLAYANANAAPTEEVLALAEPLAEAGGLYATHLRTEFAEILEALDEAFRIGRHARVPVVVSHLKCAGVDNWGRSTEILEALDKAQRFQPVGCDCYPYTASSSTLDLKQVTDDFDILVTWSQPHPEQGGKLLAKIAADWGVDLMEAAKRLQPAGAVYHCMEEDDVRRILRHPATVVGSDGLPNDPLPHPRLWGAFPRVLGRYSREQALFPLAEAVHKMTGLSAERFGLSERGFVREGYWADLVLFDPATVADAATFTDPMQPAYGISAVWVNGVLSWQDRAPTQNARAGRFVRRGTPQPVL